MGDARYAMLEDRGVITVAGPDAADFLQGLISNDVTRVSPERAIYGAFLTPQGKYLHDFFVSHAGEAFALECEAARHQDLLKRLRLYKLRSKVELAALGTVRVAALFGTDALATLGLAAEPGHAAPFMGGVVYVDPRLAAVGARAVLPAAGAGDALEAAGLTREDPAGYDALRLAHGLPDGSRDLVVEKAVLLESNFEELNGLDWDKGCYLGQEVTARTKYRGLVRKRLLPVEIEGATPPPDTAVMAGEKEAGRMRSAANGRGLALLRLDAVAAARESGTPLTAGAARITPRTPDWANF